MSKHPVDIAGISITRAGIPVFDVSGPFRRKSLYSRPTPNESATRLM